MSSYQKKQRRQSGAVSLFVVIFAMLIITVITVGFLRLMMNDQQQASNNDLSQSAYDSAQAGVEDAKRALLYYQQQCNVSQAACASLSDAISQNTCNVSILKTGVIGASDVSGGSGTNPGEIKVQQSVTGADTALDQAYTCVLVSLKTPDYIGTLSAGQSQLVPMISDGTFNTVTINWFSREDITNTDGSIVLSNLGASQPLLQQSSWQSNTPSVMRTQLVQFGSNGFTESDFDATNNGQSNANTVFLYPSKGGVTSDSFTGRDFRASNSSPLPSPGTAGMTPFPVKCQSSVASGGYACSMSLTLPDPINGGDRTSFLRLTPYYNATHFQVILSNGTPSPSSIVKFKDVQPQIDSTGRANDLFRRVQSRVDLYDTSFPYPDATISVSGNFCKDFAVTDTQYFAGSCTP
ncbi:MAG TPA: hypothetical protein VN081_06175 [Dongiaceae bacterium]|nr:hypothetical protein [Dongiaceae bacterium]